MHFPQGNSGNDFRIRYFKILSAPVRKDNAQSREMLAYSDKCRNVLTRGKEIIGSWSKPERKLPSGSIRESSGFSESFLGNIRAGPGSKSRETGCANTGKQDCGSPKQYSSE
jgi:hypothetical protein